MALKTYQVNLKSESQLHEPTIILEGIKINIWSTDGGLTWENEDVKLEVRDNLDIYMSCKAMTGTDWIFFIKVKNASNKCYDEEGTTGEELDSRGGKRIPNFSERHASVNC